MTVSDYLVTDDLTIILGLVGAGLFLLHNLYKPQSLVHPILLGRQSDVARVRNAGESALYRNYGTGMLGRFPARPNKEQQVLLDLVKPEFDAPRTLWSTKITNLQLRERAVNLGSGLIKAAGLEPEESNVLLLLNDSIEFLITDLALASHSIPSFTLASLQLLAPVLQNHPPSAIVVQSDFLPQLLELIHKSNESVHHTIIVVGELDPKLQRGYGAVKLLKWDVMERTGSQEKVEPHKPGPLDVFTVSFFSGSSGGLSAVSLTHENLTAGVASARALLPLSGAISPLDTLVSGHSLSTAYGRAIAYTAVFEGTNFATLRSSKLIDNASSASLADVKTSDAYPIPSPTIIFGKPSHVVGLSTAILAEAKKSSFLYGLAWRHKFSGILDGFITKQSLWDRLVFDNARVKVMGKGAGTVRAIIASGEPLEESAVTPARIALSIPVVNVYTHPAVSGPVFASHPLDLQTFPAIPPVPSATAADNYAFTYESPVGPPTVNIESKLLGVNDAAVEGGSDPVGQLWVRGPSVGKLLYVDEPEKEEDKGWVDTGDRARVLTNGTFKIASSGVLKK
ncbi:acetyl-CoA synthetase-like protein [Cristinia sonorae]|uniref:Acetyl-CoA synthetase-like protein n=1 Tax=Cristinia sonorae TaxID=1940300 RepID=A0A8K0XUF1_9AGAR|nr:acetyl-CoA synthetase-like protein [Cristinia sonorae]